MLLLKVATIPVFSYNSLLRLTHCTTIMVQVNEQMEPAAEMLMSFLPFDLHSCVVLTLLVSVQVYEQMEPPAEMLMSLLPFQKEFLAWAISQERSEIRGGILADEMGMGKTIQVPYRSLHRMCDNL